MTGRALALLWGCCVFASLALAGNASGAVSFVDRFGSAGGAVGQFSAYGIAASGSSEAVADYANNRVDTFSGTAAGPAFGWGVTDGWSQFETCTSTCQAGLAGGGDGEFDSDPDSVAMSDSFIYAGDGFNLKRVEEFDASDDSYQRSIGSSGFGAGQITSLDGIAAAPSGYLYVLDDARIDEFTAGGGFVKAYGLGVVDGQPTFETCTAVCQQGVGSDGAGAVGGQAIATNGSGAVYVADSVLNRIDEFSSGAFVEAFGWGVVDGAARFETCTDATGCQPGVAGAGAGEFLNVTSVAVDPAGDVFAADSSDNRVDEFDSSGNFVQAFGWGVRDGAAALETCTTATGCRAGLVGDGSGELDGPSGVAAGSQGNLYVLETGQDGDPSPPMRISHFLVPASEAPTYTLYVSLYGTGSGSVSGSGVSCPGTCSASYAAGTSVVLTASPVPGATFTGWSGPCAGTGSCTVDMNANQAVAASFATISGGATGAGGAAGGNPSGSTGGSRTVTSAEVLALLRLHVAPTGKAASIRALLKAGGLNVVIKALEAGSETTTWYFLPPGAHLAAQRKTAKPIAVASGRVAFAAAGTRTLRLKLTTAGVRLMKHSQRLKLTAKGTFKPSAKPPITATREFTLTP